LEAPNDPSNDRAKFPPERRSEVDGQSNCNALKFRGITSVVSSRSSAATSDALNADDEADG